MSDDPIKGVREPPPPSKPHPGPRFVPEQYMYIPEQEMGTPPHQQYLSVQPFHHTSAIPPNANDGFRVCGPTPFPPAFGSPIFSVPPPNPQGNPPPTPMFPRFLPPPPVPPRFTQPPPPALPRTSNIPHQFSAAAPSSCTVAPQDFKLQCHSQSTPPFASQHHSTTSISTHLGVSSEEEEEDLRWLEEFERRVSYCSRPQPSEPTPRKNVKLMEVQGMVQEAYSLMQQLSDLKEQLTQVRDSANEEEWCQLVQQANVKRRNLQQILQTFQDKAFIEQTKTLLRQRRAKRKRVKRRRKCLQLEKEELKKKRREEEAKIDAWREKLQHEEERKRRENAIKCEADSILSEVRQKQNEAQRMVQLLEALATLRHARATQAHAQGQPEDSQGNQRFTATTEFVGDVVRKQLKEYELEEQTLRVMMEESATHHSAAHLVRGQNSRCEDAIKKVLFGPTAMDTNGESLEAADHSLETLVQRREEWDQFVVERDIPLASSVPLSWVLPPTQPHPRWAKFLSQ